MSLGVTSKSGSAPHELSMWVSPMGTRLGIYYDTWSHIETPMPPTSNLHVGHKLKVLTLCVQDYESIMSHGGIFKNGFSPHQVFMWDTKYNFQSFGYRARN